jgi:hypothetical protein
LGQTIVKQLGLVESSPLDHERQSTWGQRTGEETYGVYPNLRMVIAAHRMEVRRRMIGEVHQDHDFEEPGDFKHSASIEDEAVSTIVSARLER